MAIYTIDCLVDTYTKIEGKWVIARPVNYKYRSFKERLCDAWAVFSGKADAVKFIRQ